MEERLNKFLNERCYEITTPEEKKFMIKVFPNHEGLYGINKESLKDFIRQEISL